jgi:hypothetical protein
VKLRDLDFFGVHDFVYGGDPEWVRRRWYLFAVNLTSFGVIFCCIILATFRQLDREIAKDTIEAAFFYVIGPSVVGFLGIAAWERGKLATGTTTVETQTVVTEPGPPETIVETNVKETTPAPRQPVPIGGSDE